MRCLHQRFTTCSSYVPPTLRCTFTKRLCSYSYTTSCLHMNRPSTMSYHTYHTTRGQLSVAMPTCAMPKLMRRMVSNDGQRPNPNPACVLTLRASLRSTAGYHHRSCGAAACPSPIPLPPTTYPNSTPTPNPTCAVPYHVYGLRQVQTQGHEVQRPAPGRGL